MSDLQQQRHKQLRCVCVAVDKGAAGWLCVWIGGAEPKHKRETEERKNMFCVWRN